MGISYRDLDLALDRMEHGGTDADMAEAAGITPEKAASLRSQVAGMKHKRSPPLVPDGVTF